MSEFRPYPKQGPKPKKEKKPLKRSAIKKKFKVTGEGETFAVVIDSIGYDTPVKCFVCGLPIALITHNNFAHVISKKQYPLLRNEPEAIKILCHSIVSRINEVTGLPTNGCHGDWDFKPHSELTHEMWTPMFELAEELKEHHKQLEDGNR